MTTASFEPQLLDRLRWGVSDVAVLARRFLLRYIRIPALIVFVIVQPVMFVLLFRYVFGGAIGTGSSGVSYVDYLIPGVLVQTAAFGSFGTAIGLADDVSKGVVDRFKSLPITRSAVLVARILADTLQTAVVTALMIGVGYATGFRFHGSALEFLWMYLLAVTFGTAFLCVSAFIGLALKDAESVQSFGLIWLFPLTFASGVFVPVASMPGWLAAFARNNPVTIAAQALRDFTFGQPAWHDVWITLAWTVGVMVVFIPLAVRAFRRAA